MHTTATDSDTWFPLPQLRQGAAQGRIGEVAPRFHGAPTNRSHRVTIETDARSCWRAAAPTRSTPPFSCRIDRCATRPSALVARHLEANGIPTVVMGCAKDIVEYAGVPRFLFSDFPLGNSAGQPHDPESQALTLELALRLLESGAGAAHHRAVAAALERGPRPGSSTTTMSRS